MSSKPLITVFIPYYNDEKFLKASIESVLNNDYENFELILLNHATTDSCREIAHSYNDSRIIHIDMEKNYGAGGGLLFEKMLDIAKGKYIKPLCADDTLLKTGISDLVEYMEANPNVDFAFGNIEYINSKNIDLKENWFNEKQFFSLQNSEIDCIKLYLQGKSFLPWIGSIIKREILSNIKINKTFVMTFDMSIWCSLLCSNYKIGYLDKIIANYRIHDKQISSVDNKKNILLYSNFERNCFCQVFFYIKTVDLAKQIWPNCQFNSLLKKTEDLPFYISYNLFKNDLFSINGGFHLNNLLNDDIERQKIEQTFGYGIKELRREILQQTIETTPKNKNSFKDKIYKTNIKELTIIELLFLILRKIVSIILLKNFRHKMKSKEKYTL